MLFLFIVSLLSSVQAQPPSNPPSTVPSTIRPSTAPSTTPSASAPPSAPSAPASPTSASPSRPSSTISPSSYAPTSSPPGADIDTYVTIEAGQTDFTRERLMDEIHTFFRWPAEYTPLFVDSQVDPRNSSQLVVHYKVGGNRVAEAFQIWKASESNLTSRTTASPYPLVDFDLQAPSRGCAADAIIDCQPTSFQNADLRNCECETSLTGLGVFTYVILPIALIIGLIVAICFFLPGCPLYQRAPVDRRQYKAPPQDGEGEGTRIAMDTHDSEA